MLFYDFFSSIIFLNPYFSNHACSFCSLFSTTITSSCLLLLYKMVTLFSLTHSLVRMNYTNRMSGALLWVIFNIFHIPLHFLSILFSYIFFVHNHLDTEFRESVGSIHWCRMEFSWVCHPLCTCPKARLNFFLLNMMMEFLWWNIWSCGTHASTWYKSLLQATFQISECNTWTLWFSATTTAIMMQRRWSAIIKQWWAPLISMLFFIIIVSFILWNQFF